MFGTFKFNEKTRLSDATDGIDSRTYTRTACDFCRLKKLRCSGDMKSCERCQATSTPCTYTLSSGNGKGRKRVRRQPFSDSAVGCFPVEPERSDDGNSARRRGDGASRAPSQSSATKKTESPKYHTAVSLPPEAGDSAATSTADSVPWQNSRTDLSSILAFPDDGDYLGMDDSLDLVEAMLIPENDQRPWDTSPLQSRDYIPGLSDDARIHLGEKPKADGDGSGRCADGLLTDREPAFVETTNEVREHSGSGSISVAAASPSTDSRSTR
ncbi:hypothetical protein F4861DRAFT_330236 [Xylaria intraflava]|nr:hypothetical protein F4861DRAFT_330236 [Xylaria intraflava]